MILTFLMAPDIPAAEVKALEAHYLEAMADSDYIIVVNYPVAIAEVEVEEDDTLVVSSTLHDIFDRFGKTVEQKKENDEICEQEVEYLQNKIIAAMKGENKGIVVTNYDLDITTFHRQPGDKLVVVVEDGRTKDIMSMREKLDNGEKLIVSAFPVAISLVPPQEQK